MTDFPSRSDIETLKKSAATEINSAAIDHDKDGVKGWKQVANALDAVLTATTEPQMAKAITDLKAAGSYDELYIRLPDATRPLFNNMLAQPNAFLKTLAPQTQSVSTGVEYEVSADTPLPATPYGKEAGQLIKKLNELYKSGELSTSERGILQKLDAQLADVDLVMITSTPSGSDNSKIMRASLEGRNGEKTALNITARPR